MKHSPPPLGRALALLRRSFFTNPRNHTTGGKREVQRHVHILCFSFYFSLYSTSFVKFRFTNLTIVIIQRGPIIPLLPPTQPSSFQLPRGSLQTSNFCTRMRSLSALVPETRVISRIILKEWGSCKKDHCRGVGCELDSTFFVCVCVYKNFPHPETKLNYFWPFQNNLFLEHLTPSLQNNNNNYYCGGGSGVDKNRKLTNGKGLY